MENYLFNELYIFMIGLVLVGAILLIQSGKLDNDIGKIAFGIIGLFFAGMLYYCLITNLPFISTGKPYTHEGELKDGSIKEALDCYEKDEKKICEFVDGKRVVEDYWEIDE